jgi:methionine-rich copper-binding protein CopC
VQLLKLELVDAGGEAIDIDFTPASAAQKTFSIVLPVLKAAGYMVNWTVLGKDGHKVAGVLEFVVDPQSGESTGTTEAFDDHGKHH